MLAVVCVFQLLIAINCNLSSDKSCTLNGFKTKITATKIGKKSINKKVCNAKRKGNKFNGVRTHIWNSRSKIADFFRCFFFLWFQRCGICMLMRRNHTGKIQSRTESCELCVCYVFLAWKRNAHESFGVRALILPHKPASRLFHAILFTESCVLSDRSVSAVFYLWPGIFVRVMYTREKWEWALAKPHRCNYTPSKSVHSTHIIMIIIRI